MNKQILNTGKNDKKKKILGFIRKPVCGRQWHNLSKLLKRRKSLPQIPCLMNDPQAKVNEDLFCK